MSDVVQDGRTAERILNDPVFQRAVDRAKEHFVEEWMNATTIEGREKAHGAVVALARVVQQLKVIEGAGVFEEAKASH